MKIQETTINGVFLIEPEFRFEDHRGEIFCAYQESSWLKAWREMDPKSLVGYVRFKKDNFSMSYRNVLRGIHVSPSAWKLATCVSGRIFLVVVDCRETLNPKRVGLREYVTLRNPNFGKWQAFKLNDMEREQVLIPPMCGLAHLVLSRTAIFYYKWSDVYRDDQMTYRYDDPRFKIKWPIDEPILSERDKNGNR
mgnify:CR=1 FL=1